MRDRRLAALVGSFHANDVIARLFIGVFRDGVAVLGVLDDIAVGLHGHLGTAVAEIPGLLSSGRAKSAHLESNLITGLYALSRIVNRMHRGRNLLGLAWLLPVHDLNDGEIICGIAFAVGDLQDFAVGAGLVVGALDGWPGGVAAVGESPRVAGDLAVAGPGSRPIQGHGLAAMDEVMRPGGGDDLRFVLALISVPEEGIAFLGAPCAGGLPALDLEMQMRPATAAALLAQQAEGLGELDPFA